MPDNETADNARLEKFTSPGAPVPRTSPTTETPSTAPKSEESERKATLEWCDEPSFSDQFVRYNETTRTIGPQFFILDMNSPDAASTLEAFLMQQYPALAPRIIVHEHEKHFSTTTDNWKVIITYDKVQYRKFLEKDPAK